MSQMPREKTRAAALGFCGLGQGQDEFGYIDRRMRFVRRPSRAGRLLDELGGNESRESQGTRRNLVLLKQLGRARGGPKHRVQTANPSISLRCNPRKKKTLQIIDALHRFSH